MFTVANVKTEYKEAPMKCFGVKFQGKMFNPCVGLSYWIRWGKYVFDIRLLREYLNLEPEAEHLSSNRNKLIFEERIKQITDVVGERNFIEVNIEANKLFDEKQKQTKEFAKNNNLPFSDDLGF